MSLFTIGVLYFLYFMTTFLLLVCLRPIFVPLEAKKKTVKIQYINIYVHSCGTSIEVNTCNAATTDHRSGIELCFPQILQTVCRGLWTPTCNTHSATTCKKKNTPQKWDNTAHTKSHQEYVIHVPHNII